MLVEPGNCAAHRAAFRRGGVYLQAVCWLAVVVAVALLSPVALSQQYKSDQPDEKLRNYKNSVLACAAGAKSYSADKQNVLDFFVKYLIPSMTRYEPADLERLGSSRYLLVNQVLWKTNDAEMQSDVTAQVFPALQKVAAQPYHPAARYNAILIIGLLDKEYAIDQGANRRPPKPLPEANKFLVVVINSALAGKPVPPALVAGALVGLERHAKYREALSRDQIEGMTAATLKIVASEKPLLDVDRDIYAWIRLKAAGVLAQLGSVGANNQVHDGLMKMVGDGRTIDDRCATAGLLGKIKYDGAKVDGKITSEKMIGLASAVADAELKRAEEFRDQRFAGGAGAYSGGERGGPMIRGGGRYDGEGGGGVAIPEDPVEEYPRRQIVVRLSDLRTGLKQLQPVMPADDQKKFDTILAAIDPVIDAAANKDTVSLSVARAVVDMANTIKSVAGTSAPAAAAVEDAGFDKPAPAPAGAAPAGAAPAAAEPAPAENPPAKEEPAAAAAAQ